jgi:RimJ/RimL family protein N-acetyltransferase
MPVEFAPLTHADAAELMRWRYPAPYDFYNMADEDPDGFLGSASPHWSVRDDTGEMIGFIGIGVECTVPGGDYSQPATDIGIGMRPDQTGRGFGKQVIAQFIDDIVIPDLHPPLLRATIAAFNQRSLRTFLGLGFQESARFLTTINAQPFEWVVVTRTPY